MGQQRVGADLDEGAMVVPGGGDGLAEPHRLAHVGHPVVGVEQRVVVPSPTVEMNGIVGVLGARSASAARNSGRIGSISAVCEATSMLTRRANRSWALHRGDHRVDRLRAVRRSPFGAATDTPPG